METHVSPRSGAQLHHPTWNRDDFPLHVFSLKQGTSPDPHWHEFIELVYVRSGSGLHRHGRRDYPIIAGDCFVIAPGEEHAYIEGRNLRITNVLFLPSILQGARDDLARIPGFARFFSIEPLFRDETSFQHKLHFSLSQQRQAAGLLDSLERETRSRTVGFRAMSTGLFLQLVTLIGRGFDALVGSASARQEFSGKERTVAEAISFLETNFPKALRLDDVAREACLSPSRLSHVFKEATGTSLLDYLTRIRVDRAAQMLRDTAESITEVAFAVGFHDPAYFTRTFRKITGQSPSVHRKSAGLSKKSTVS